MKKSLFLLLLLAVAFRSFAQPSITNLSFPSSVNLFDKYEISFNLGPYGNPYDPDTISYININFPSEIRDLVNHTINNTFGDAVFRIILSNNNNSEN